MTSLIVFIFVFETVTYAILFETRLEAISLLFLLEQVLFKLSFSCVVGNNA